jgi:hydroxylamine reductase (hybrid-cluster protein)
MDGLRTDVKAMPETKVIRINSDIWIKLQKAVQTAVADYDFTVNDLVDWILRDVDLDEYAKKLAREVEFEVEASNEDRTEAERAAEEEETSTDEERAESADDEAENVGTY